MSLRSAGRALALARHAAPAQIAAYALLSFLSGIAPLATAWLTKFVIDRLATASVRWLDVLGLAAVGISTSLIPHAVRYLRAESDRRVLFLATTRLYAAVDRFVGLRRFEDPAFLDRLQIARSSGVTSPAMVVDGGLGMVKALLTVIGFAGTILLLGPWVAVAVLLAAVPALLAELGRRRRKPCAPSTPHMATSESPPPSSPTTASALGSGFTTRRPPSPVEESCTPRPMPCS